MKFISGCFYTRLWPQSTFLLSAPGVVTMTFSGVVSRNTSPTTSLPSAVTSLNATGTTLGAPLAQVASVCPVCQEALSDEESAEAPPAAEEARRFRGSVLAAGRGSGWEPADTTVSAEEHAKKSPPKWVVIYGAGDEESAEAPPAAEEARRFRGSVPTAGRGSGWEPADTTVSAEEHAKKITTQMGGDLWSGRRGSNSLPRPWQGRALPDELRPQTAPLLRHLGASGRSRTNDTRIFSPLLYQLSYRGIWRPRRGSNPRPPA